MEIQVNESQADELGHVYNEGKRLFCRIRFCHERRNQTQDYSKLTSSRDPEHDGLVHDQKQLHRNIPT